MQSRRHTRSRVLVLALGVAPALGLATLLGAAPVQASDSLSRSIFADESDALWPIEVSMEVVPVELGDEFATTQAITVEDGHTTALSLVEDAPTGRHTFSVDVVARHHARHQVELEYDLVVHESRYQRVSPSAYVLHRLDLGPGPELGPARVRAVRSDIVSLHGAAHIESVTIGRHSYEVRLTASSTRP